MREGGLVFPIGELEAVELAAGALPHGFQPRLDLRQHVAGQRARQVRPQSAVGGVLIAQFRGLLDEGHCLDET